MTRNKIAKELCTIRNGKCINQIEFKCLHRIEGLNCSIEDLKNECVEVETNIEQADWVLEHFVEKEKYEKLQNKVRLITARKRAPHISTNC